MRDEYKSYAAKLLKAKKDAGNTRERASTPPAASNTPKMSSDVLAHLHDYISSKSADGAGK